MADKTEYRSTLNLPRTEFPMKADLVRREPEFLAAWERAKLYEGMRAARRGAHRFILHDGPPYANGQSHLGHLLNNVLKDAVLRYKFLRGFDVPFIPGWDCHGQPIEHQYLKTAGLKPREVDPLALRKACAEFAMKFVRVQREQRKRVGAVGDWEHPYLTMDKALVATEIEAVGRLIREGYIFRGKKPVLWCSSCETALAENAVEYGPHVAPSVYVKFRVTAWPEAFRKAVGGAVAGRPADAVIWTTTPWTLPANVALAFNRKVTYDLVDTGEALLLLAADLAPGVLVLAGLKGTTVASVPGEALAGLKAAHPFLPRESVGILAEYVSLDAGTGIVHTAPGHGDEDYRSGVEYRLPVLAPVDERGRFTPEFSEFAGVHVFEANAPLIALLKAKGALLHEGVLEHSYPFCWRCKNPVIFRATEQWFIALDHKALKQRAAAAARAVAWTPEGGGERMGRMVDLRPDWCISRQRVWGTPIPVFYCTACGQVLATEESLGAVRDWVAEEGADVWWTRDAEALLPASTRCPGCGGRKFRKETDTLDVWFDSGVTHTSVVKAREDLHFPADLYLEAQDQFRGWFQSSLLTSVALNGQAPYKAVLVHGWVLDPQGDKMSKSVGNVVTLDDAVGKWGADVMRWWALAEESTADMRLSAEAMDRIQEAYRKLRNTLRFLLGNLADWAPEAAPTAAAYRTVDRVMRWRLARLVREATADLDRYAFHHACQKIHQFCVVDLSALYLDVLKDRLYASRAGDPGRRAAQAVLAEIFGALVRMLAPILPFTAEDAWAHAPAGLTGGRSLVQLTEWPVTAAGEDLAVTSARVDELRDAVHRALEAAKTAGTVAMPLESRVALAGTGDWAGWLAAAEPDLPELLVVSQVQLSAPPAGSFEAVTPAGTLRIGVSPPAGAKCGRCWLVKPEVGTVAGHADLCTRCAEAVG